MRLRIRSLMMVIALLVLTGAMAMAQNGNVFTCSSNDGQLHSCRVNTDQPIQFVGQRSSAQCIQGETYGINRGGVWVTNGCSADFAIGNTDQAYNNNGYYNQQGTYNNGRDYDQDDQNNNGAYNNGTYNRNDGYRDQNGNWHSRHHRDHDNDRDHDRNNNGYYGQNGTYNGTYNQQGTYQGAYNGGYVGEGQQHPSIYYGKYKNGKTTCSADPGTGPVYCQTNGALSNATINKSNGQCQRGQNWDINSDGLWVADGCSAEFQIQR